MCKLRNKIPKQIPVMLHNWPYYEYNFSINELAKESGGQFKCLGETRRST